MEYDVMWMGHDFDFFDASTAGNEVSEAQILYFGVLAPGSER